jgi:F420-non-reducing hydrogenase small subunit
MSDRPKVALYWCASCGGCEETFVDLGEGLLDVAAKTDIVFWPAALDFKYEDLERHEDGSIAVAFINGAVRTSEQEEIARLLRRKSAVVVAFGACAASGGIPALANLTTKEEILRTSFRESATVVNPDGVVPRVDARLNGFELTLPAFSDRVMRLADVIEVDYVIPGCPPTAMLLRSAVLAILEGRLPERGSVLAPGQSLCRSCRRTDSKPDRLAIDEIRRVIDVELDPDLCFLAQGVICQGPATRDGCGASCVEGNMPCTGCFGPTDACLDQGGKMISALGTVLADDAALDGLVDPAGTFYRYGLSASLLTGASEEDS